MNKVRVKTISLLPSSRADRSESWRLSDRESKLQKRKSDKGTATVEFAIVLPLLIGMLLGTLDFGRVFYDAITLANATRAGAQYGSLRTSMSGDIQGMRGTAEADAIDLAGVSITAEQFCECPGGSPIACNADCFGEKSRVYVRVVGEKTFETLFPYPGIPQTVILRREAVMRAR